MEVPSCRRRSVAGSQLTFVWMMENRVAVAVFSVLLLAVPLASAKPTSSDLEARLHFPKHPKILVSGHVFCDRCRQGLSSLLTVPLAEAEVGVKCVDVYGFVTYNAVGYTGSDGLFRIPLDDLPLIFGVKGCKAQLLSSSDLTCNIVSSLGGGASGAMLVLNSRSLEEVIFTSGPFAFHPSHPLLSCSSPPSHHRPPLPPLPPKKRLRRPPVQKPSLPPSPSPSPPSQHLKYKFSPPPPRAAANHKPPLSPPPKQQHAKSIPKKLIKPPPHHGHLGHKSPPPPSPGLLSQPPPPPHHGHQGHISSPPPSP